MAHRVMYFLFIIIYDYYIRAGMPIFNICMQVNNGVNVLSPNQHDYDLNIPGHPRQLSP